MYMFRVSWHPSPFYPAISREVPARNFQHAAEIVMAQRSPSADFCAVVECPADDWARTEFAEISSHPDSAAVRVKRLDGFRQSRFVLLVPRNR